MKKPIICPHVDCECLSTRQGICVGKLPKPVLHDGVMNTHRWCLLTAGENGGVFDLQVNWSDIWQFVTFFNIIARNEGRKPFSI